MRRKQKRTNIIGALIFVALVALVGFGLITIGTLRSPFNFFGEGHGPGSAPASQNAGTHEGRSPEFAPDHQAPGMREGRGPGFAPDHAGPPDGENTSGIAWNQIGGVFSDLWILAAIAACYILVQQALRLINSRFWVREYSPHIEPVRYRNDQGYDD